MAPEAGLSGGMVVGGISRVWGHGDNVMSYGDPGTVVRGVMRYDHLTWRFQG